MTDKARNMDVLVIKLPNSEANLGSSLCNTQKTKQTMERPKAIEKTVPSTIPSSTVNGRKFRSCEVASMSLL